MSPRWEPNTDVRKGRHVTYSLHVHLVFVTKYRRNVLTDPMLSRCEQIMSEVCADFEAELREFNGEHDHVHLLVHYPPKVALSKLVNSLKGVTARRLRQEYAPPPTSRSTCGAATSGQAPTSPDPAAAPQQPRSSNTSKTNNAPSNNHTPSLRHTKQPACATPPP